MKRLIAISVAVLLLAGCGNSDSDDAKFFAGVGDKFPNLSQPELKNIGRAVCVGFAKIDETQDVTAITWMGMVNSIVEGGVTINQAESIVGAATAAYCPKYVGLESK